MIHVSSMTTATYGWSCWVVVPMITTSWLPVDCNALSTVLTRSSTMYVAKTHTHTHTHTLVNDKELTDRLIN